jgi:drug/metabolite transporter (DMT)-like permease
MNRNGSRSTGLGALALAVPAASFAAVLIRLAAAAGADPLAIAALRLTFASVLIAPVALTLGRRGLARITGRDLLVLVGSGFFLALHFGAWITSLSYTSVASSVLLVTLQPVFVPWLAWIFLREGVSRRGIVGLVLAILGTVVIAVADRGIGMSNLVGDLLALVGALSAAFYVLAGRSMRNRVSLLTYVWPVYGVGALVLVAASLAGRAPLVGLAPVAYMWIFVVAVVCQVLGHTMYNLAVRNVPAYVVAAGWLIEPIGSTILAFLILHEAPPGGIYLGAPLIFAGVFVVLTRPTRLTGGGLRCML